MMTLEKFEEASEVVQKVTLNTSLIFSDYLSEQTGNKVYLKPENMQFTGAYKVRGAKIYRRNVSINDNMATFNNFCAQTGLILMFYYEDTCYI